MITDVCCPFCDSARDVDLPIDNAKLLDERVSVVRCDACDNRFLITYAMTIRTATSAILDAENSTKLTGMAHNIHTMAGIK